MIHPPQLDHIVDRQITLWDTLQRAHPEGAVEKPSRAGGPWVTVSMQLGSEGVALAEGVGARLGWQVFNKEIVSAIASRTHAREKILSRLDEHAIGALQDYVSHLFVPDHPGRPAYLIEMVGVLWAIAREGRAVILGRGANWLLDPSGGLRVRVIASLEKRIERIAAAQSLTSAEARRLLKRDDADRAAFVRQVFRRDIDEVQGYDLVVNTGALTIDAAIETVVAALVHKTGTVGVAPSAIVTR